MQLRHLVHLQSCGISLLALGFLPGQVSFADLAHIGGGPEPIGPDPRLDDLGVVGDSISDRRVKTGNGRDLGLLI